MSVSGIRQVVEVALCLGLRSGAFGGDGGSSGGGGGDGSCEKNNGVCCLMIRLTTDSLANKQGALYTNIGSFKCDVLNVARVALIAVFFIPRLYDSCLNIESEPLLKSPLCIIRRDLLALSGIEHYVSSFIKTVYACLFDKEEEKQVSGVGGAAPVCCFSP